MPILNYTTSINPEKTVAEIQIKLAKAGAQAVLCEYDEDGIMKAISFRIKTSNGHLSFRLPSNIAGIYKKLVNNPKVPNKLKTHEQATRVAWRILKDWLEAQLAIIEAEMADIKEVFLPYAQNPQGKTLYETLSETQFKLLTET
ncbi:MAG: hypothetical protein KAX30_04425 [Candidatus Atribacteria bacterium]|nr:hypothetical protein [Candidatus Atribacteria bacterium]